MSDKELTSTTSPKFDFGAYPADTLFGDRRLGLDRRGGQGCPSAATTGQGTVRERRRTERRRRVDPTTFDKQYTYDEIEFMTAIEQFKVQSGKVFPSHREVLKVAASLGYRRLVIDGEQN